MSALINFINESTPKRMIFVKIEPALAHKMSGTFGIFLNRS